MKRISLLILASTYLLSAVSVFDKAYVYMGSSIQKGGENEYNKFESKASIEKNIELSDSSSFLINAIVGYALNNQDTSSNSFKISQAYYQKYWFEDIMSVSIGRVQKDFSFSNAYSILNFLGSNLNAGDPNDRYLTSSSVDGISAVVSDPYADSLRYIAMHTYVQDISSIEGIKKTKVVLEATRTGDSSRSSLFLNKNTDENLAFAAATTYGIGDSWNYYGIVKYQYSDEEFLDGLSSSSGFEYTPTSDVLISVGLITLGGGLRDKKERQDKYASLNGDKDKIREIYNELNSYRYLTSFIRHNLLDSLSYTILGLYNIGDSSVRAVAQIDYKYENLKLFTQYISHMGDKWSEFGEVKENGFENKVRFLVSYSILN